MSKQSDAIQTIIDNLNATLDDIKDNSGLLGEVQSRIDALTRAKTSIVAQEELEVKRAENKVKSASRVAEAVKVVGKEYELALECGDNCDASDCSKCVLCKLEYMQAKGMSVEKIKLVLGL